MTNGSRAADCAAQSNPDENPAFRRLWGDAGATGPTSCAIRAWHASDLPVPPVSLARKRLEVAWLKVTRRAAP